MSRVEDQTYTFRYFVLPYKGNCLIKHLLICFTYVSVVYKTYYLVQRLSLKKFEEDTSVKITVNLCLSIVTRYSAITIVNKPSYYTTRLNQFKYNQDDSKIEVHDITPVSSINYGVAVKSL